MARSVNHISQPTTRTYDRTHGKVIQGINILNSILQAQDVVIAIEEQNKKFALNPFLLLKKNLRKIKFLFFPTNILKAENYSL